MARDDDKRFTKLVQGKVESLVCHLHGYGTIGLTEQEWENLRLFASFLFKEVEEESAEANVRFLPRSSA